MSAKFIYPIFSQKSGLEISAETKESREGSRVTERSGRVQLRFFLLEPPSEGKTTQLKFICEPFEAYDLFLKINRVVEFPGKEKLTHKFRNGDGVEIVTTVTVEHWQRGEKSGFGFSAGRGNDFISVPISQDQITRFLYAGEFLRFLSTSQQWVEMLE